MSFLTLPNGIPDFGKAVISFWFRVPQASLDAAAADETAPYYVSPPPLFRCIPLLTFGKEEIGLGLAGNSTNVTTGGADIVFVTNYTPQYPQYSLDPCQVAINCFNEPRLQFNIQMARDNPATAINYASYPSMDSFLSHSGFIAVMSPGEIEAWENLVMTPGSGVTKHAEQPLPGTANRKDYFDQVNSIVDISADYMAEAPEFFYVQTEVVIKPDTWHHLLLSFDVSRAVIAQSPPFNPSDAPFSTFWNNAAQGVSSHALLWYALDDVDYRGRAVGLPYPKYHLGPYSVDYDLSGFTEAQGDPNGILTYTAFDIATTGADQFLLNYPTVPITYNFTPKPISGKDQMGLPASDRYKQRVYRVEMAEFQMFTGVTLDTGKEKNRRAFIDADGNPVDPTKGTKDDPDGPAPAEKLLGKKPDVLLHGSDDWKEGANTGTTGIRIEKNPDGRDNVVKIPSGQFIPTGGIEQYEPDPELSKP